MAVAKADIHSDVRRSMDIDAPVMVKSSCCGGTLEEHHHHQAIKRSESSLDVLGDACDRLCVKIEHLIRVLDRLRITTDDADITDVTEYNSPE